MDIKELEALLARVDERTDGDYLARLENGVCIASECAAFIREHGPELLRIYRAWQGAAVVLLDRIDFDGDSGIDESLARALIGTRVRLLPDDGQGA